MSRSQKVILASGVVSLLLLGACTSGASTIDSNKSAGDETAQEQSTSDRKSSDQDLESSNVDGSQRQVRLDTTGGLVVAGAGAAVEEGEQVEVDDIPTTDLTPDFLENLDGLNISRVSETLKQDGTYEYQLDFNANVSYGDVCAAVVSEATKIGYDGFTNCEEGGDASLKHDDGTELRFLTVKGERAVIRFTEPSSDALDPQIEESAPSWLSLPDGPALEMERIIYTTEAVAQYDYDSKGKDFEELCLQAQAEVEARGFELATRKNCETAEQASVSFKNGPFRLTVSNAYGPIIRYETRHDLQVWAEENDLVLPVEPAPDDTEEPVDEEPIDEVEPESDEEQADLETDESEEQDDQTENAPSNADCSSNSSGVAIYIDGAVCKDGELIATAPLNDPIVITNVDDLTLTSVSDSLNADGTIEHQVNFTSSERYADLCRQFILDAKAQGYVEVSNDCDGRQAATLERESDSSELRFLTIDNERALMILKAASNNDIVELVKESVPSWSTPPNLKVVKQERIVTTEEFDLEIDYENDGSYIEHCEQTVAEAQAEGFVQSTIAGCENGKSIGLNRANLTLQVSNATESLIVYKYRANLEG